jgi:hypothetical protein
MKTVILFLSISAAVLFQGHAQWIDQFYIMPSNPTTGDDISLFYSASFPSTGCNLISYDLSIAANNIICNAYHEQGMLTVICNSNQTFQIGMLNEGSYLLVLNLFIPGNSASATLNFNVTGLVGLKEDVKENTTFIYPNPVNTILNIESADQFEMMQIFSSTGQSVALMPFSSQVDLSDYMPGLYIIVLQSDEHYTVRRIAVSK